MKETLSERKTGAIYIRVSTDKQEELSPDAQLRLLMNYAKTNHTDIPMEYIFQDNGISGRKANKRPAFQISPEKEQRRRGERVRAAYRRSVWLPDRAYHRMDGRILLDPPVRGSHAWYDAERNSRTLSERCSNWLPIPW